jgi:hypothetical protein
MDHLERATPPNCPVCRVPASPQDVREDIALLKRLQEEIEIAKAIQAMLLESSAIFNEPNVQEIVQTIERAVPEAPPSIGVPIESYTDDQFGVLHVIKKAAQDLGINPDAWDQITNSHGRLMEGTSITSVLPSLWQHVVDTIRRQFCRNGWGLRTDGITVNGWSEQDVRKVLRAAMLFHDIGKADTENARANRSGNRERSTDQVQRILAKNYLISQGQREVIASIVEVYAQYGEFLRGNIQWNELSEALMVAHVSIDAGVIEISEQDFRKLTWLVFVSDVSTIGLVASLMRFYPKLSAVNDVLDFSDDALSVWIAELRTAMRQHPAPAPTLVPAHRTKTIRPTNARPRCDYGPACSRTNPNHKAQCAHVGDADYRPIPCRFGAGCTKKYAGRNGCKFDHPTTHA